MSFGYRYRKQIVIGMCCLLLVGVSSFFIVKRVMKTKKEEAKTEVIANFVKKKETSNTKEKKTETLYKVDIKGEVINPGIYSLSSDSRVIDVINLAGGLTDKANTSVINLSKKISDEMVIIIYSNGQVQDFEKTKEVEKQVIEKCQQVDSNAVKNDACIGDDSSISNKVININTATVEELMTLPGIGEAKAKDIISYRDSIGGFKNIEQIKEVSGIGDSVFAKIKDYLAI